ncbi:MAG: response regulator transcription factor [Deltaproteobacteria bacterium]|nr:response regulator transcription factor [Deltaproteobacteria bacterium]
MEEKKSHQGNRKVNKVLIVDDHWVVTKGIEVALADEPDFEVIGTASDGRKALEQVRQLLPDIVILDISMPELNGVETTAQIRKLSEETRIVIFTMYSDREYVIPLFRMGISGYILKEEALSDLILALKSVSNHGTYFSPSIQRIIRDHMEELEMGDGRTSARGVQDGMSKLSAREKEVFPLLADGLSPREIGKRLYISPKTVESHKYNIMDKLGVTSLAALTKIAIKKHLIDL